ncbi:hypothetical protein EI555_018603, partial [Monodon monoceros]
MAGQGNRYYTYTGLLAITRRFRQNPNELMITWILRGVGGAGRPDRRCPSSTTAARPCGVTAKRCWRQRWESFLHLEGTELPFRPWSTMEEGIQLVQELGMFDWIYREPPLPEPERLVPEDVPFTQGLQRRLLAATPSELRLSLVGLLAKGVTVLEAVMVIQTVTDVGLLWHQSQPGRARLVLGPNPTRKDLMGWLLSHGMPKERVDRQPTKILLELYIQEARRSHTRDAFGPGEEQPPCPPYSDQACGAEPPQGGKEQDIVGETQSLGRLQPVFKEPQRGVSLPPAHPVGVTSQSWWRTGSWLIAAVAGCQ